MLRTLLPITPLLLLFLTAGCDRAQDLATEAVAKAKKDVVNEITKSVNGGGEGKEASREREDKDDEHK